jgi:hypothetical protein
MQQGITTLYKFPVFDNRDAFRAVTGQEAPPFDPSQPIKQWLDPAALSLDSNASVVYKVWNGDVNKPELVPLTMNAGFAAKLNLPGAPKYPPYVVAPTGAAQYSTISDKLPVNPVNPALLSLRSDADRLAAVSGAAVEDGSRLNPYFEIRYPADEQRRAWLIRNRQGKIELPGCYVGYILAQQNANGVGAPGHWDQAALVNWEYVWVPDKLVTEPPPNAKTMPVPCRDLQEGERLESVVVGLLPQAMVVSGSDAAPAQGCMNSGLTAEQDAMLRQLAADVKKLLPLVGAA